MIFHCFNSENISLGHMRDPNFRMFLFILALYVSTPLFAQGPPVEGELPIDQHLHYLVVVGLAVGLYWAYKQIKSQRSRD